MKTAQQKNAPLSVPFEIKAESANDEARTFQGLASTWQEDLGGDVIHQGAFARTLSHWKQSGKVLPLIDMHGYESTRRVVGKLLDALETDEGLLCTFQIMEAGDPDADAAWRRVKGGYISGLSIGYRAVRFDWEQPEGTDSYWDRIRHLREVALVEVSLVIWGMNPGALIDADSVKSLVAALRAKLSEEEEAELKALPAEVKDYVRALLMDPAPTPPAEDPAPVEPEPKGLAPEDPARIAMDAMLRELEIRSLSAAA